MERKFFMNSKLTLSVDKHLINKVKKYAKERHTDVSALFSNVMIAIIEKEKTSIEIEPIVKELMGIIRGKHTKEALDSIYRKHLEDKYL